MSEYSIFNEIILKEVFFPLADKEFHIKDRFIKCVLPFQILTDCQDKLDEILDNYLCHKVISQGYYSNIISSAEIGSENLTIYVSAYIYELLRTRKEKFVLRYDGQIGKKNDKIESVARLLYTYIENYVYDGKFSITPSDLNKILEVDYSASILNIRLLQPAVNVINEMFNDGKLLCGCHYNIRKSPLGKGNKIIGFDFIIKDLFLERLIGYSFTENIDKIKAIVRKEFENDFYPIIEYQIDEIRDKEYAYRLRWELEHSLLDRKTMWNILTFHFGICITQIPSQEDMFRIPTPKQIEM